MFCTPAILERLWCLPFGAKIVHYNLENDFFDLNKTWI